MDLVVLKTMLKSGQSFILVMTRQEAEAIVESWSGTDRSPTYTGRTDDGYVWSFSSVDVECIHTFSKQDFDRAVQQAQMGNQQQAVPQQTQQGVGRPTPVFPTKTPPPSPSGVQDAGNISIVGGKIHKRL